jgi:hypothetical protein
MPSIHYVHRDVGSDKFLLFFVMSDGGQGGNMTVGRENELVSTSFPSAHGTNFSSPTVVPF